MTLSPLLPIGVWIPWSGSAALEWTRGLTRLLHLAIEGGQLKLTMQQSVGPKIGGAGGLFGQWTAETLWRRGREGTAGYFHDHNNSGVLVWTSGSSPYRGTVQRTLSTGSPLIYNPPSYNTLHPTLGTWPGPADPTNYRSIYTVDVKGYFGRRS